MDVAIITIAVIVIHVWRTMMEEIHRCQHLFTENDLDVATGTMQLDGMSIAMAYVPWQSWRHIYEAGKGFRRGTIFEELDLPFKGKEDVTHERNANSQTL